MKSLNFGFLQENDMLFCLNDLNEVSYATLLAMGRLEELQDEISHFQDSWLFD